MLVASMNPCPYGYCNNPEKECSCAQGIVQRYLNKISGPLLDRIDQTGHTLLKNAMETLNLSARAYDRILKVSRTIAYLDGSEGVRPEHR
jgi:predicted ATPase with chaperone activity